MDKKEILEGIKTKLAQIEKGKIMTLNEKVLAIVKRAVRDQFLEGTEFQKNDGEHFLMISGPEFGQIMILSNGQEVARYEATIVKVA